MGTSGEVHSGTAGGGPGSDGPHSTMLTHGVRLGVWCLRPPPALKPPEEAASPSAAGTECLRPAAGGHVFNHLWRWQRE